MKTYRFPSFGPWLLACVPFVAGCGSTSSVQEREAVQEAVRTQEAHAAQVDASNALRTEHASQLIKLVESAKTQPVKSRVDGLIAKSKQQNAFRQVMVYGISTNPDRTAELHARQMLLLAAGSEFSLQSGNLRIRTTGNISGAAVTPLESDGNYHVVQLSAAIPEPQIAQDAGAREEEITQTTPLESVLQSIADAVRGAIVSAEAGGVTKRQPGDSNAITARGRVVLKSMNLIAGKSPPQCVYTISVSWVSQAPPIAPLP